MHAGNLFIVEMSCAKSFHHDCFISCWQTSSTPKSNSHEVVLHIA